jgi:hypothetical protein
MACELTGLSSSSCVTVADHNRLEVHASQFTRRTTGLG